MEPIPIIDGHQDLMWHLNRCQNPEDRQTSFELLNETGVMIVFASVFSEHHDHRASDQFTMAAINEYLTAVNGLANLLIVEDRRTVLHLMDRDEMGLVLHIEGADSLRTFDWEPTLQVWKEIGVRSVGIVWNETNQLGGGAYGIDGLTKFGRDIICWLDSHNMIVDLAHMNEETFWDTIQVVERPPIISHGNCQSISNHPRNYTDLQILAVASKQGVIGISCVPGFVNKGQVATLNGIAGHFLHVIDIAGIDHVGFGSDYGGIMSEHLIAGAERTTALQNILRVLEAHGLSQWELEKIAWGNFARVIKTRLG